ncbi:hypothetical protein BLNAU_14785 [Blattamonas nauphoetae]|uniref:Uncharacterized protein n=1 Tax=Blattamonas nauphoetae TaxID=2049346 RepID=A0ABQ9XCR8_9EUKA|nr:hypothetical protein BLNAU_14785 [Blattamonas nauphoetae]
MLIVNTPVFRSFEEEQFCSERVGMNRGASTFRTGLMSVQLEDDIQDDDPSLKPSPPDKLRISILEWFEQAIFLQNDGNDEWRAELSSKALVWSESDPPSTTNAPVGS